LRKIKEKIDEEQESSYDENYIEDAENELEDIDTLYKQEESKKEGILD
jgi:hypothetical protein